MFPLGFEVILDFFSFYYSIFNIPGFFQVMSLFLHFLFVYSYSIRAVMF